MIDVAFVVAKVEVGFGAVVGDEHLAVLERRHRSRIDIDVRIELLHRHFEAAFDQQPAEGRRRNSLPQRGDHAAGNEDVLRVAGGAASSVHLCCATQCASARRRSSGVSTPGCAGRSSRATPMTIP